MQIKLPRSVGAVPVVLMLWQAPALALNEAWGETRDAGPAIRLAELNSERLDETGSRNKSRNNRQEL